MPKRGKMGTVSDINVTPLVDVMLVLLIIFMVITPMLQKGISVDLPRTQNPTRMPDAEKEDSLTVAISRDGTVYLQQGSNVEKLKPEDLAPKIKDILAARVDKTVYIRADQRSKYGVVVDCVDNVRAAGVDRLGMLTEKVDEKGNIKTQM